MEPTEWDTMSRDDLTARARIRQAAIALFAERGYRGTSVRAISESAGVSPALIVHHYGSKDGLRRAVDEAIFERFTEAMDDVPDDLTPEKLTMSWGEAFARVLTPSPSVRGYLRRSLLEHTDASTILVDRMIDKIRDGLAELSDRGLLRTDVDPVWCPYQMLFVIFGTVMLEPHLRRDLQSDPYSDDMVQRRGAANFALLRNGILRLDD